MSSVQFEENVYYEQAEKPDVFHVTVTESPLAEKWNLAGDYEFHVNSMNFCLVDKKTKKPLLIWPYRYLRRYGKSDHLFQFEAGRKCKSGDGVCKLITKRHDAETIFNLVQKKAKSIKDRDEDIPVTKHDPYDVVEVKDNSGILTRQYSYENTKPNPPPVSGRNPSVKGKPTPPSQKPTAPGQKPTTPSQKPTVPSQKPTAPSQKPTAPSKHAAASSKAKAGLKEDLNDLITQNKELLRQQVEDVDNTYGALATKPQPQLYGDAYSCVTSNTPSAPPVDDANLYDVINS